MPELNDDIEKYLKGQFNSMERHRLEKKALADPFLAEALQGGESLTGQEFSDDLNAIRQKINFEKRNSFFWPLRVAAGIILIISITWITVQLTENETSNHLALQKQEPTEKNAFPLNELSPDPSKEMPSASADQQTSSSKRAKSLQNQPVISEKPQVDAEAAEAGEDAVASAPVPAEQELKAFEMKGETITDKEKDKQTELSRVSESDEKKIAVVPSKRDEPVPAATRSLALRKKSEAPGGAAVAKDEEQPTMGEISPVTLPMPVGGIPQFNKYVEENLRYPQAARSNNIQGDVIVEFEIDANGNYRNFRINKSLGYGCDEEAIRLIKEGPKWNSVIQGGNVINNKASVTIPFRIKNTGN